MKKIALSMIYKGTEEGKQIDRLLRTVAPYVDAIYATATWTKDGEATKVFEAYGAKISFFQWEKDFAKARNYAKAQIPDEFEYMIWLDTDDKLQGGEHLKKVLERDADAFFFIYNYQIDENTGQVLIKHPRERVVRKNAYEWVGKLHETLIPQVKVKTVYIDEIAVNHYPTKEEIDQNILRNIEILEKTYDEEGKEHDPRTEYYLGRCYFDSQQFRKAEKLFYAYLEHSGWDEERAMAWNYLAEIYLRNEMLDDAVDAYLQAVKERPEFPTWYINLGVTYGKKEDWDRAIFFTQMGLQMNQPKTAMVTTPMDDKVRALETIYLACVKTAKLEEALVAAEKLCQFFPNDDFFIGRYQAVVDLMEAKKVGDAFLQVIDSYEDKERISVLVNNPPERLVGTKLLEKLVQEHNPPKTWPEKSIAYFVGKGFEKWDESNLAKGIGGSETAVIHLAENWAKQGYQVTVFGDPVKGEHEKNGVTWTHWWKWNMNDTFDTLIFWRNETMLNTPCKANRVFLDLHDVPSSLEYTKERLDKVDKIFVKSPYHRSLLPNIPDEKFVIIPNGVDLSLVPEKIEKKGKKVIWSSSYDRGLQQALEIGWPIIKAAVPDAEFHIYYGWNLFDTVHKNNPERIAWKAKMERLMDSPSVFHHGRVSQKELIQAKSEALVHYYPSTFEEIDCIGVRESAAVDCIPVTTDYAALKGRRYCLTVPGNPLKKETQESVANLVVETLKPKETIFMDGIVTFQGLAREESWPNISALWLKEIN